jgi:3-oxoacyl-[acyl-carrier protein] reductase
MIAIDLSGKTAIVTGASQGLGTAIAKTLHQAGANVVVNYFADPANVNASRAQEIVQSLGDRAIAIAADVRSSADCANLMAATIKQFRTLDIVVNNAGILRDRSLKNMSETEWQEVIDTNLTGVFNICRAALPVMSDGGRFVNISSIAAAIGFFGQANYASAKAGVMALTKVMSRELGKRRINVNAIAPGVVLTDMGKSIPENVRQEMLKNIPLGRFGEPEEIANAILFLCSDLAQYITGQTLHVNGGWWG